MSDHENLGQSSLLVWADKKKKKKSFVDEEELQLALGDGQKLNWEVKKK